MNKEFKLPSYRVNPEGYIQTIQTILNMLKTKKLVALFNDFKETENDVLFELYGNHKGMEEMILDIWNHYKQMADVEHWFKNLGK